MDGFEFLDGGLNVFLAEQVFAAFVADAVYFFELVAQDVFQQDVGGATAAFCHCLGGGEILVA